MYRSVVFSLFALGCAPSELDLRALQSDHVEHELLVGIADLSEAERRAVVDSIGYTELRYLPAVGAIRLDLGTDTVEKALLKLRGDARFRYAEPNYVVQIQGEPNDPRYGDQWHMKRIRVAEAWVHGRGEGTVVAVLDTGVEPGGRDGIHDLQPGADMVYGRSVYDAYGHGTHCAGTIAQNTDNGIGTVGVAPGTRLLPVKVLGDSGYGSSADIAAGIEWAADNGADVISMSIGWWGYSTTVANAVSYAHDRDVVLVGAAGNEDTGSLNYPAAYDEVISVGATRWNDRLTSFTNWGEDLDLVAPGEDVLQEVPSWYYSAWSGTSMATPHVAGVAALIVAQGIDDPQLVREILHQSAVDLGDSGRDEWFGHGLVDAAAAVELAISVGGGDPGDPGDTDPGEDDPDEPTEDPADDGPDESPPQILNATWGSDVAGEFWMSWQTDEPASSHIWFEQYGWFTDWELSTDHHRTFTGAPGQQYSFWINSDDASGNEGFSGPHQVTVSY